MFRQAIKSTPLTTEVADSFFKHIDGDNFQGDKTFISTLRALVAPRMKDGEKIDLYFRESRFLNKPNERYDTTNAAVWNICSLIDNESDYIYIHNFCSASEESNNSYMELMESSFTDYHQGWHRLEKVTDFFKKAFNTLCFINPDKKSVVLFVDNMDIRKMHYLQCSIFAILPWYFDPKQGVSSLEMKLIESLRSKDFKDYEECIAKIAEKYDFRTAQIRKLLAGFETRYERKECDNMRQYIANIIHKIDDLNQQIGSYLRQKNDSEIRLLGLEAKIANSSEESEIMDYFLCNDKLVLESVSDTVMTFSVKTYLEYFDEDLAERAINNSSSYVYYSYDRAHSNISGEDMKKLMTEIFINQTLKIKFCAAYQFDMNGSVYALENHRYGAEFREYTPNTHIDAYHCLGNYQRTINELLKDRNYIGAIEQCIASCKSLNFGDSVVMSEFMRRMYSVNSNSNRVNTRCIELPDGNVVTPIDAINWIKSQEDAVNE